MPKTGGALRIPCCILLALSCTQGKGADSRIASPVKSLCGEPAIPISSIQGSGAKSPMIGKMVDVEAVVVGRFQGPDSLGGLFIEEEPQDHDGNDATSEGLFIHTGLSASVGDLVHVRGKVAEFKGQTELHPVRSLVVCRTEAALPIAKELRLPVVSVEALEAVENMRVVLPQTLTIIDTHALWLFGELVVASKRQLQPTQVALPGSKALAVSRAQALDRLIVDDGRTGRKLTPADALLSIRTGQQLSGLAGVLHFAFGDYRLQPGEPFTLLAEANPRSSDPPDVGGTLRVASFNVLNYFSTLKGSGKRCGPDRNEDCRGADNHAEQGRQLQKLVAAISAIDAGIVGLLELENNPEQSLKDLVEGLNKVMGDRHYAFIVTGTIGRDAIKAGLLYQPALLTPQGRFAVLDGKLDPRFNDTLNRPALAQSFHLAGPGSVFTVVVTHLKSKNCAAAEGRNLDQQNGQGCFNATRTLAANAVADWALRDPTGSGSKQVLIMGDFNSHRLEDPIRAMDQRGLVNLLARLGDAAGYTYVYDGRTSTLDYAFASPQLLPFITGAAPWHINADEPELLDYNLERGKPAEWFSSGPFRSSDHDPVIVGLDFAKPDLEE